MCLHRRALDTITGTSAIELSDLAYVLRLDTIFNSDSKEHIVLDGSKEVWLRTDKILGCGAFGVVTMEVEKLSIRRRALKCIPKDRMRERYFFQELNV